MNQEEYKELNKYLNETFSYLEKNDTFYTSNIVNIWLLNKKYYSFMKDFALEDDSFENKLTYEDIYLLAREVIESINPKYLNDFDKLIQTGELDFRYNKEFDCSEFFIDENGHNNINIDREFNYTDVVKLVHEFIHYVSGKNGNISMNRFLLSEFFSIYFETYTKDYLIKKGIPKDEIDYKERLRLLYNDTSDFMKIGLPYVAYSNFGDINDTSYELMKNYITKNITRQTFNEECDNLLNHFKEMEKDYREQHFSCEYNEDELRKNYAYDFSSHCEYLFCTLLAFYARSYCNIEDIVYMNDHINDIDCDVVECLNKMGIYIDEDDFLIKIFESIEYYLYDYEIKQR